MTRNVWEQTGPHLWRNHHTGTWHWVPDEQDEQEDHTDAAH